MKIRNFTIALLLVFLILASIVLGQPNSLGLHESIVDVKDLPKKTMEHDIVLLNVKHIRQKPGYCVPTSCAMMLRYIGQSASPVGLKKLAENHKPKNERNESFTYWKDIQYALKQKGHHWNIQRYEKTDDGFESGLEEIKSSLREGLPVMIEVHLDDGHSFVVIGFDDKQQSVFIRDPLTNSNQARVISYEKLKKCWHNHKYGKNRSALFSGKPVRAIGDESSTSKS